LQQLCGALHVEGQPGDRKLLRHGTRRELKLHANAEISAAAAQRLDARQDGLDDLGLRVGGENAKKNQKVAEKNQHEPKKDPRSPAH
jgi:hypothetical protein